jgi:hypothetical protein
VVRDDQVVIKRLVRNLLQDVGYLVLVWDDFSLWTLTHLRNDIGSLVQLKDSYWLNLSHDEVHHFFIILGLVFQWGK